MTLQHFTLAPYLDEVYGSRVCTYVRTCLHVHLLCVRSGAYSPCDSYVCTCAVVTPVPSKKIRAQIAGCAVSQEQAERTHLQSLVGARALEVLDCKLFPEPVKA